MLLNHSEAENILRPYKNLLWECVTLAWNDFCSLREHLPHLITARTRASIIHDFMVSHARNRFAGIPSIRFHDVKGLFLIEIDEKILIRFKKLNEDKRPSNIPTQQTLDFLEQLELPNMPPHATKLVVGYELNKLQSNIQSVDVTCPNGSKNEWVLELEAVISEADIIEFPTPEISDSDVPFRLRTDDENEKREGQNG